MELKEILESKEILNKYIGAQSKQSLELLLKIKKKSQRQAVEDKHF